MQSEPVETASTPASTTIPVQLSAQEFEEFILSHLSLPKRGPQCKIGYHKPFNYILKVLYTGMQWKELPIEKGGRAKRNSTTPGSSSCLSAGPRMVHWSALSLPPLSSSTKPKS